MSRILNGLLVVLAIAYPPIVFFGLQVGGVQLVGGLLAGLFLIRFLLTRKSSNTWTGWLSLLGAVVCGLSVIRQQADLLLYYPVMVSTIMLIVFSSSLVMGDPVIERLARLTEPDLDDRGVRYCRSVTKVWCAFFIFNGSIALYTAMYTSFEIWSLYNGLLSYLLMGLLFSGEWLVRMRVKRGNQ